MTPIARVLITMKCQRHCDGCCNNYESLMSQAVFIDSVEQLAGHETVCVTGGEPMLDADRTVRIIHALRANAPRPTVYLYTAFNGWGMTRVVELVDGVHFSLHAEAGPADFEGFYDFQCLAMLYPEKSFRLYVDQRVSMPIRIVPSVWRRVEVKPWIPEGRCPLPEGETLYILREDWDG